jgi:hypothetical protein
VGLLDSLLWFAPRLTVLSFVSGSKEKSLKVCTCPSCEITRVTGFGLVIRRDRCRRDVKKNIKLIYFTIFF